jgi:hypothetical protein
MIDSTELRVILSICAVTTMVSVRAGSVAT